MSRRQLNKRPHQYKAELMERILEVRFTDLNEEKRLCKELLEEAEPEQDTYGCAFANTYLLDSCLALGDYASCDFYLSRANHYCKEYGYDNLLLVVCNCAGLYYLKLNDAQTALQYYLDGLRLAKKLKEYSTHSKLLNNIGLCFAERDDWATAKEYFENAFAVIQPHLAEGENTAISYLNNLAEACRNLGDVEGSLQALDQCEKIGGMGLYQQIRLACGRAAHYAFLGDRPRFQAMANHAMALGLMEFDNKYFVSDMCIGLLDGMLVLRDELGAKKLLEILDDYWEDAALVVRYRILCLRIQFFEMFGTPEELNDAYQQYDELEGQMSEMDDKARAQSMLSKIQLMNIQIERESLYQANRELEDSTQIDELTGLFNRRYFNKLVSKTAQNTRLQTLGFVMLDLDYFKQYNDFYGHFEGDTALKTTAELLNSCAIEGIHTSRYGGDEFVCLCVNLPDETVERYAKCVCEGMAAKCIPHEKSLGIPYLTLSLGYCNEAVTEGYSTDSLHHLADMALYTAKQAGRNRYARRRMQEK